MKQETSDLVNQAVRAALAAAGAVASAITLSEWVAILTGVYIVVQLVYLLWKWSWERREKRAAFAREARREEREERAYAADLAREAQRQAAEALQCLPVKEAA